MKHKKNFIVTAGFSAAATLGLVAALGFAQPDGIDPPAGPVSDTQPSLTSIDTKVDSLVASGISPAPSNVEQFQSIVDGSTSTLSVGSIHLERVIMLQGRMQLEDSTGQSLYLEGASQLAEGARRRIATSTYELNTVLTGPIDMTGLDPINDASCILVYKELP